MKLIRQVDKMQAWSDRARRTGKTISLVPTMGCLHKGHLRLVRHARQQADVVVVSIFVNPMQFGPKEDFRRYPRRLERDLDMLKKAGADIVFASDVREMYPQPLLTVLEVPNLSWNLCGRSRPGHFRGVCTVVAKLLHIVKPHTAVFGAKDFQQATVVQRMVRDLNFDVRLVINPTVREEDGLAMSSRNVYLTPAERRDAAVLNRALKEGRKLVRAGNKDTRDVVKTMRQMISAKAGRVDYIKIVNAETLEDVTKAGRGNVIALAVFFGRTRLIDNIKI